MFKLKYSTVCFSLALAISSVAATAQTESVVNLGVDKEFNFRITDIYGNKPERCVKPTTEGTSVKTSELADNNETICRIYEKPTEMLDSKSFTVMLHKGSFILTIIDDNGMIYQVCYDDTWNFIDCRKL